MSVPMSPLAVVLFAFVGGMMVGELRGYLTRWRVEWFERRKDRRAVRAFLARHVFEEHTGKGQTSR